MKKRLTFRCTHRVLLALFGTMLVANQTLPHAEAQNINGRNIRFGTVILATGCHNRFVVATKNGLSILDFIGGSPVLVEDVMGGDMETIGQTVLSNQTRATKTTVFVEASLLSGAQYRAKRQFLCR